MIQISKTGPISRDRHISIQRCSTPVSSINKVLFDWCHVPKTFKQNILLGGASLLMQSSALHIFLIKDIPSLGLRMLTWRLL